MNARKALIEAYKAAVIAIAKRGTLTDARHEVSAAEHAAGVEHGVYAHATKTKADFVEYCEARAAELIECDHAEALEMAREWQIEVDLKAGRPVCEETGADLREWCGYAIEAAHGEALREDAMRNQIAFWSSNDEAARCAIIRKAHKEALAMDTQRTFNALPPFSRAVAWVNAEAEAWAMNEEISLCREIESLTYEQAVAYSDQRDFENSSPEAQVQMVEAAHAEALAVEVEEDHELALAMNRYFDALRGRFDLFWSNTFAWMRDQILATHHENALRLDALITGLINEIREAMEEARSDDGVRGIAIKVEASGLELESADVRFAAVTAGRLAGVAA